MNKGSLSGYVSLGCTILSLIWLWMSAHVDISAASGGSTPRTFPLMISGFMCIISVVILAGEFMKGKKRAENESVAQTFNILRILALVIVMVLYTMTLDLFGFVPCTIVLMAVSMLLFGYRNRLVLGLVSAVMPVALKLLFENVFHIFLP
ncbi:MAG: tripartite tricarboxylate transporter TctB family protein [Clostridium sp.]|nr:tripartite tricarboxylate transporter TctB family protein [Clostridium sp.]